MDRPLANVDVSTLDVGFLHVITKFLVSVTKFMNGYSGLWKNSYQHFLWLTSL